MIEGVRFRFLSLVRMPYFRAMVLRTGSRIGLALLVVLTLGYAQSGYFLRFEWQRIDIQRTIKQRIRQGVPKHELTPFSMSLEAWQALHWVKPGREFRMPHGDMYDVVDLVVSEGRVEARCIHDEQETQLFAGLSERVRRQLDGLPGSMGARERITRLLEHLMAPWDRCEWLCEVDGGKIRWLMASDMLAIGYHPRLFRPPWHASGLQV